MENKFIRFSGICLIIGSLLMIITMVLHPSGGSIEHILKISTILMVSHSLAIFSLPFVGFGFYGLSMALLTENKISILAFIISCQGLIAGMLAAMINGLTLPLFLSNFSANEIEQNNNVISPIIKYGSSINHPLDYILIVGLFLAIGIWSVLIILGAKFPKWVGYFGISLLLLGILGIFFQYNFIALSGFRIVVFGMATWIIIIGVLMSRVNEVSGKSI